MKPSDLPKGAILCYYRDKKGLRGVIVAIGPNILGWSLCHKNDRFDKGVGIERAYNRASIYADLADRFPENRDKILMRIYGKVPQTLHKTFDEAQERSFRYFK